MKLLFTLFCLFFMQVSFTQVADFENYSLDPENYLNGDDFSGGFISGDIFFPNVYSAAYQFWTGFAVSNVQDVVTAGIGNQYASFAGEGAKGSSNYAIAYASSPLNIRLPEFSKYPVSIYLTNSTYTALSMRDGDQFAKKFGGESGDDPDYYYVTIKSWFNGSLSVDSINHYLADFRFDDNALDYISDSWEKVDLSVLGESDSLQIEVYSSDVGAFGINTPTYFSLDELIVQSEPVSINEHASFDVTFYPNPVHDKLTIVSDDKIAVDLISATGNIIMQSSTRKAHSFAVESLVSGIYFLRITSGTRSVLKKIIKQ